MDDDEPMTSRRAGGEGRAPPSPSSSGSEDNGFSTRPRVVGVYVKNLSRQELDTFVQEDIYGVTPTTSRGKEEPPPVTQSQSQSSSSSTSPSSTTYSISTRTSLSGRRDRAPGSSRDLRRRRQEEGRPRRTPEPGDDPRRTEPEPEMEKDTNPGRSSRNSNEDKNSEDDSSRLSPSGYEVFDQEDSSERTIRQYADDSEPEVVLEVDDRERGRGSREGQEIAHFEEMFPRCFARSQTQTTEEAREEDREVRVTSRFRSQDSMRLRPPLVGTAGTSADSGTGDSASAEIQVEALGSLTQTPGDVGDNEEEDNEDEYDNLKREYDNTPGEEQGQGGISGGAGAGGFCGSASGAGASGFGYSGPRSGKQTVKPFTKESLDRLESRTVQLVREYGFQPRRKTSVEDGAVLPHKFEPFPSGLYGRPLEEIDNFIYDEVRYFFFMVMLLFGLGDIYCVCEVQGEKDGLLFWGLRFASWKVRLWFEFCGDGEFGYSNTHVHIVERVFYNCSGIFLKKLGKFFFEAWKKFI